MTIFDSRRHLPLNRITQSLAARWRLHGWLRDSQRTFTITIMIFTLVVTLGVPAASMATILTFTGPNPGFGEWIPDSYGSRVDSLTDAASGFAYELGHGFTPNVVVDYRPEAPIALPFEIPFLKYPDGYGDLIDALGGYFYGTTGDIVLIPDPGYYVALHSFDVAAWDFDREGVVQVLDNAGDVLFDSGVIVLPGVGGGAATFLAGGGIFSSGPLHIDIDFFGDLGVDNISFSQLYVPGLDIAQEVGTTPLHPPNFNYVNAVDFRPAARPMFGDAAAIELESAIRVSGLTTGAIPEPATFALCLISIFAIGFTREYRRRSQVKDRVQQQKKSH